MARKTTTYAVLHPNGEWEQFKVPKFFTVSDIAEKLQHSEVAMWIPRGHIVTAASPSIEGPCWALWSRDANEFVDQYRTAEQLAAAVT